MTYIQLGRGRGATRHHLTLRIPIEVRDISERTSIGTTRTNYSLEGLHKALQNSISCQHPNILEINEYTKAGGDFGSEKEN